MRAVALLALSGCSFLFQTHLESEYSGNSEPVCSTSKGWAAADGIVAGLNIVGAIAVASVPDNGAQGKDGAIASGIIDGIVFGISALTGLSWANGCREERERWDSTSTQTAGDRPVVVQPAPAVAVPSSAPRGFFCSASAASAVSSFCVREKSACVAARDAAIGSVPDLERCELRESAWCFGERCAPVVAECDAQRDRAIGSDGIARECEETR